MNRYDAILDNSPVQSSEEYCDECKYLDQKEFHPKTKFHWCSKFKIRVFHLNSHPHIYKCSQCFKKI